jgi:hypothetical protein
MLIRVTSLSLLVDGPAPGFPGSDPDVERNASEGGPFWDKDMLQKFNDWMTVEPKFQP